MLLVFVAVSLHVWVVQSSDPQEPVYATIAARLVTLVLSSPPLPLAPPLRLVTSGPSSSERPVTLRTTFLNIPAVPTPPFSSPAALARTLKPAGPSGNTILRNSGDSIVGTTSNPIGLAAHSPGVPPQLAPAAPPALATPDDAPPVAPLVEPRPAPTIVAAIAIPQRETRIQPAAAAVDRLALSAANRGTLPADRRDVDSSHEAEDQVRQKEVVLAVVHEYARALERFDVHATKAVYPSVNDRRLRRSFEDVEAQQFQLVSCGVSFSSSGHDANARCLGNSTFRPKVGTKVLKYTGQEWVFNLARDEGGWQILEARVQ